MFWGHRQRSSTSLIYSTVIKPSGVTSLRSAIARGTSFCRCTWQAPTRAAGAGDCDDACATSPPSTVKTRRPSREHRLVSNFPIGVVGATLERHHSSSRTCGTSPFFIKDLNSLLCCVLTTIVSEGRSVEELVALPSSSAPPTTDMPCAACQPCRAAHKTCRGAGFDAALQGCTKLDRGRTDVVMH